MKAPELRYDLGGYPADLASVDILELRRLGAAWRARAGEAVRAALPVDAAECAWVLDPPARTVVVCGVRMQVPA